MSVGPGAAPRRAVRQVVRCLAVLLLLGAGGSRAECRNIEVSLQGPAFEDAFAHRLRRELDVELERTAPCGAADTFRLVLVWELQGPIAVSAGTTRNGTEREFRRSLEPTQLPADGLAPALAAVAAELVTELARAPALPVEQAAEAPAPVPPAAPTLFISARGAAEGWSRGQAQAGGDLALRWAPSRLAVELWLGGRAALARSSAAGTVQSQVALVGLACVPALWRNERLALSAEAGLAGGGVWFSALPSGGYSASSGSGWVLSARAGLELGVRAGGLGLSVRAGVDVPLHGVAATADAQPVVAVGGVGGYAALGGGFWW